MTRDVIIRIKGIQTTEGTGKDETEIICPGIFFEKDGRCYVKYEEAVEDMEGSIQNLIKFSEERLEVTKRGLTQMNMVLERGKKSRSSYSTPFGNLTVSAVARRVDVRREEEEFFVEAEYDLEINDAHMADARISIHIQSKDKKEAHLLL